MALSEKKVDDQLEVLANGLIQVRTATIVERDGEEVARSYHRHVVTPVSDLSSESQKVKDIAGIIHTAEVKAAYEATIPAIE